MAVKIGANIPSIHGADKQTDRTRQMFLPAIPDTLNTSQSSFPDGSTTTRYTFFKDISELYVSGDVEVYICVQGVFSAAGYDVVIHPYYTTDGAAPGSIRSYTNGLGAQQTHTITNGTLTMIRTDSDIDADDFDGEIIGLRVDRIGGDGSDTYDGILYFAGILLKFTGDQ